MQNSIASHKFSTTRMLVVINAHEYLYLISMQREWIYPLVRLWHFILLLLLVALMRALLPFCSICIVLLLLLMLHILLLQQLIIACIWKVCFVPFAHFRICFIRLHHYVFSISLFVFVAPFFHHSILMSFLHRNTRFLLTVYLVICIFSTTLLFLFPSVCHGTHCVHFAFIVNPSFSFGCREIIRPLMLYFSSRNPK